MISVRMMMISTPAAPYLPFPFSPILFSPFVFSLFDVLSFPDSPAPSQTLCSNHSLGNSKCLLSAGVFHNGNVLPRSVNVATGHFQSPKANTFDPVDLVHKCLQCY